MAAKDLTFGVVVNKDAHELIPGSVEKVAGLIDTVVRTDSAVKFDSVLEELSENHLGRAIMIGQRISFLSQSNDSSWILLAEMLWRLRNDWAQVREEKIPLWRVFAQDPEMSFADVAMDQFDLARPDVSQLTNIWDTFAIRLGRTRDELILAGSSKLRLSLSRIRKLLDVAGHDNDLEYLLFGDEDSGVDPGHSSYREIQDHLKQVREDQAPHDEEGKPLTLSIALDNKKRVDGEVVFDVVAWRNGNVRRLCAVSMSDLDKEWPWQAEFPIDDVIEEVMDTLAGLTFSRGVDE